MQSIPLLTKHLLAFLLLYSLPFVVLLFNLHKTFPFSSIAINDGFTDSPIIIDSNYDHLTQIIADSFPISSSIALNHDDLDRNTWDDAESSQPQVLFRDILAHSDPLILRRPLATAAAPYTHATATLEKNPSSVQSQQRLVSEAAVPQSSSKIGDLVIGLITQAVFFTVGWFFFRYKLAQDSEREQVGHIQVRDTAMVSFGY